MSGTCGIRRARRTFRGSTGTFLKNLFAPYQERKVDAVVLGRTHYPLVRKTIQKVLGSGVAVFDGGAGTARETLHKLKEYSLVSDAVTPGTVQFITAQKIRQ